MHPAPAAILVKGYPRLSETFIAQELLGLQEAGLPFTIVSLRHPTDEKVHAINARITAPVLYLPEYSRDEPGRILRGLLAALRRPGRLVRALACLAADFRRDATRNRLRRFAQALVLARELPAGTARLHAHYLHTPSSVARYAAMLTGLPWSFSAHAKDIWTSPQWELRQKLDEAAWGVTCTRANLDYLRGLTARPGVVRLLYHGLDFDRFTPPAGRASRTGADPADPIRLLTVGRAVEKKGLDVLLNALACLPDTLHWRLTHIGGGPRLEALKGLASRLGLADRIDWRGPQAQNVVIGALAEADLFVLSAIIAKDGDRDGLPNVLMEAQAMGLPCLASRLSAIPELIEDGVTGLLVEPGDEAALARAIEGLAGDPARRAALSEAATERLHGGFDFRDGIGVLAGLLGVGTEPPDPLAPSPALEPDRRLAT